MPGYYDFVLVLIPLSLLGVSGLLTSVGLATSVAVPVGAAIAAVLVGHAMFVNGPDDAPAPSTADPGPVAAAD